MDYKSQRLDIDHSAIKSYASIDLTAKKEKVRKLGYLHEKKRRGGGASASAAAAARQKPVGSIQFFLGSIVLFLVALFGTRALLSCEMFQTADSISNTLDEVPLIASYDDVVDLMKEIPSSESIRDMFYHYAANSHLAGSPNDHSLAQWTRDRWIEFGLQNASIETYYPYLNYPMDRQLSIISGPPELLYQASLRETNEQDSSPTFHAYSADGNVTGPILYINYGRVEDFELLVKNKIEIENTICLIRHGGRIPSSMKIQNAERFGCLGALIYTDPAVIEEDVTSTVVHRESVQYGFIHPGDPYTAGFAATVNATRNETSLNLPRIPSLPISWNDAIPLLRATQDYGFIEPSWVGQGVDHEVRYFTGPSVALCNLVNVNEFKVKPVWNVLAHIQGDQEHKKAVIIGNHRDAWDHGAADPSSGSAVLLELARVFGILLEKGWKPRRSIILASWDANEYGNVGSTEWVEDHLPWLRAHAVAYLNVDHAVTGPHFSAECSPLLKRLIEEVTSSVIDPRTSKTVYESWVDQYVISNNKKENDDDHDFIEPLIRPVGSTAGLDSVAFFEHAGVSSLSMSFDGTDYDVSHSTYDNISWMEENGDPTFEYHQTMVKIWGLLTLRLSDDILLPLYPIDYALTMKHYLDQLTKKPTTPTTIIQTNNGHNKTRVEEHELPQLTEALHKLYRSTIQFNTKLQALSHQIMKKKKKHYYSKNRRKIRKANERLLQLERAFLHKEGVLLDRGWYKHALFGPSAKTGLIQAFPSIVESRELKDLKKVDEMEAVLVQILRNAQSVLTKGKLLYPHLSFNDDEEEDDDEEQVNI